MPFQKLYMAGVILALLGTGCAKEDDPDLKDPVEMPLSLGFTESTCLNIVEEYGWGEEYTCFTVSGGWVGLQKIEFEGMKEAGGMYLFENYPVPNFFSFKNHEPQDYPPNYEADIYNFDMPLGIYDYFRWDLYLKEIETEGWMNDADIESLHSGFIIEGIYEHGLLSWVEDYVLFSMPFVLAIDDTEKFCFRALNKVVIEPSKTARVSLLLNWPYVFNAISHKSIEEAEISGDSLDQRIIISSTKNTDLYEMLLYRLGISTKIGIIKGGIPISLYNDISGTH